MRGDESKDPYFKELFALRLRSSPKLQRCALMRALVSSLKGLGLSNDCSPSTHVLG